MKNKKISKNIFENLLIAVIIMVYFIGVNVLYNSLDMQKTVIALKISAMAILTLTIVLIEISYRKDSGKIAINSIEILILASHTLSIVHVVTAQKLEFKNYILVSSYMFSIYYLLKAICLYTKERKDYLDSLSDIKEIVANNPTKKEATKKSK